VCPELLPQDELLLTSVRETVSSIRNTFEQDVLPALQEKLKASQKEYKSAAKALDRRSRLATRWRQDSAASLIENFSRFQHALADMRYQRSILEIADDYIQPSSKRLDFYRRLKSLTWDANVSSSSIKAAQQRFIDRMGALSPDEKTAFTEQLRARLNHRDLAVVQETYALSQSIGAVLSEHIAEDHFLQVFQEIVTLPGTTSSELYQKVMNLEYLVAVHLSHVEWEGQENALIDKLEKGPSLEKTRALGLFLLALQAGAGLQGMNRQADLLNMARTASERDVSGMTGHALQTLEASPEDPSSIYEQYMKTFDPTFYYTLQSKVHDPGSIKPTATAAPIEETTANINVRAYLIDALGNDDLPNTMRLIQGGGDPNLKGANGKTALELAVALKDADSIVKLLELGATPSTKPVHIIEELTPHLFDALNKNEFHKAIQLIQAGADPNVKDHEGWTPLDFAISSEDPIVVQALIDHGARVDSANADGYTPLYRAISYGKEAHVLVLLEAGANPSVKSHEEETPVHHAVDSGNPNIVQALIDYGAKFDEVDHFGFTPLFRATLSQRNTPALALLLLRAGADPNIKTHEGSTPWEYAIFWKDPNFVQAFIDHGAEIDSIDSNGWTALQNALFSGAISKDEAQRLELEANALVLLKAGANVNTPAVKGKSLLDWARAANMTKVVDVLIEKGAHSLSDELKTHLTEALTNNDLPNTMRLIQGGGDPNLKGANGKTALELAIALKDADSIVKLLELGATPSTKPVHIIEELTPYLFDALNKNEFHKAIQLIQAGADPNGKDEHGDTALLRAIPNNQNFVQTLIDYGANVNAVNKYGGTPLREAILYNNKASALALLEAGADPNALNAAIWYNPNFVQTLIDYGANINAVDTYGQTPLYTAILHNNEASALALLKAGADPNIRVNERSLLDLAHKAKMTKLVDALVEKGARS